MASYYAGAGDGYWYLAANASWDTVRDATTATAYPTATNAVNPIKANKTTTYTVGRCFYPVNTDGITGSISEAKLYIYNFNDGQWSDSSVFDVVETTQSDPTTLNNDDFNNLNFTSGGTGTYEDMQMCPLTLDSTGISWINESGYTKIGVIHNNDLTDTPPTGLNRWGTTYFSEYTGTNNDPYLDVTVDEGSSSHSSSSHSSSSHSSSSHSSSSHSSSSHSSSSSETPLKTYTKEDVAALPAADANLAGAFTAQNYTDVATDDNAYVDQTSTGQYAMFLFKDRSVSDPSGFTVTWKGKTDFAPSSSPVYLQVYNRTTEEWETVDSDDSTAAGTEFELTWSI